MDYRVLTRDEYRAIAEALNQLNFMLTRILSGPACPRCKSHAREGRFCGTCGEDLFPPEKGKG